jgi:hypothetical protein
MSDIRDFLLVVIMCSFLVGVIMSERKMEYVTVVSHDSEGLDDSVNQKLKHGWQLRGELVFGAAYEEGANGIDYTWAQAMTREVQDDQKE